MRLILLSFFFILTTANIYSQSGAISGVITDDITKEEIIGASINIEGTNRGEISDIDGKFNIANLSAGKYVLVCTYIGYKADTTVIDVVNGRTVEVTITLKEDNQLLQTVTITGVRKVATEVAVLNTMKESMQIISGLSAESIKRTLDSDASQVVKRIPGVTVINERFIVIRGLSERYNTTLLHNVNAPSMEQDVRSFSLDVIPSNIIDQILIFKSPAPELPSDFSGGAVKIFTKGIPDENSLVLDVSSGARGGSAFQDFWAESRRQLHWTGFNDGANNLPAGFPERIDGLPEDQLNELGKAIPNNWTPTKYNAAFDYKIGLTHSFNKKLKNGRQFGSITNIQYSNSKAIFNSLNQSFEAYDFTVDQSKLRYSFDDKEYNQEISAGIIHNWGFRINERNVIELKNLYNQLTTHQYVDRFGDQIAQGFMQNNHAFFNEYRGLYSGQLIGTHKLANESLRLEWIGGLGYSFNDLPDYRRYRTNILDAETMESVIFVPRGQTPDFLGKFYSSMREQIYSGAVNLEYRLNHNSSNSFKPTFKSGIFYEIRDRTFEARNLGFNRGFNFDESLTGLPINDLFAEQNINTNTGIRLGENYSTSNYFDAGNNLIALYISANIPLGEKFNLFGGFRIEDNFQFLRSPARFVEGSNTPPFQPVEIEQLFVLPSLTLSYNLNPKSVIKAVYGKTVNRPEFREIAPFGFYDFIFDATVTGYSFLKNATIDNMDLRWEFYPSPTETFSVALFYKNFTDPIESLYGNFGSEQSTFFFRNTERAFARGVEFDLRKSLQDVTSSRFLDKFSLLANVSLIDSKVFLGEELSTLLRAKDRPLQGQSNFILNTGVFFDDKERNLQVNITYNVIGKRILLVGAGAIPDTYEMPRNILDLNVTKGITEKLFLRVGIKDMINQNFLLLQDGNEDGKFDRSNDQIFRRFRPGTIYSVGLSYKLY